MNLSCTEGYQTCRCGHAASMALHLMVRLAVSRTPFYKVYVDSEPAFKK